MVALLRFASFRSIFVALLALGACFAVIAELPASALADTFSNFGIPVPVADGTGPGGGPYAPGVGNPYPSTLNAFGMAGAITSVHVTVIGLEHQNVDDLNLLLVAPNGRGIQLMSDAGGANATSGGNLFFRDDASGKIPDGGPFVNGTYKPSDYFGGVGEDSYFPTTGNTGDVYPSPAPAAVCWSSNTTLAQAFNGSEANGTWSLYITDDKPGDTGGLDAVGAYWALDIATDPGTPATATSPCAPKVAPPAPTAHFSVAKSQSNKYTTVFDARASLAGGAVADSFKWDFNGDGKSEATCPGSAPILATKFDASGRVNATMTVAGGGTSSSTKVTSSVVGVPTASKVRSSRSVTGGLKRQTFTCATITGQPPPEDLTANGGPPPACGDSVQFDIIDAIGCFSIADNVSAIPSAESKVLNIIASDYSSGQSLSRTSAVKGTAPIKSLVQTQQRTVATSTQTVRLNGLDFDPAQGAAIVLVSPITLGQLSPKSMPGYILSSNATIKMGGVTLQTGKVRIPLGFGGVNAKVHLGDFKLSRAPLVGDLPVRGTVGVDLAYQRAEIPVSLTLPGIFEDADGHSITGQATLRANNAEGLLLDQLSLFVPHASVAGFGVDDLRFAYSRADSTWDASGRATFPPGASLGVHVLIKNGALEYLYVKATPPDPGIQSAPGVFITYIDATYDGRDGTGFGGGVGVSAGGKVATPFGEGQCSLVRVDGHFFLKLADPVSYRADGDVYLLCVHLVHGYYQADTNGHFEIGGDADFKIGDDIEFSAALKVAAQFTLAHSQIDADLNACVELWFAGGCVGAEVAVSDVGVGICADLGFTHAGGGVVFPSKLLLFADSCDIRPFRPLGKTSASGRAAVANTFKWGGGKPSGLVAVSAANGPPSFTLSGPHRRTIHAGAQQKTADFVVAPHASDNTTYLFVRKPAAGTWTVRPDTGFDLTSVRVADGESAPSVSARLAGTGHNRTLNYKIKPEPGQTVTFGLTGPHNAQSLGTAHGSSGKLKFTVAADAYGPQQLVAHVTRGKLKRADIKLAKFTVRRLRLGAPHRLRIKRKGARATLKWRKVRGAKKYLVSYRLSDGNRANVVTRKNSIKLTHLAPSSRGTIRVRALPRYGAGGSAARAKLKRTKSPKLRP